MRYHDLGNPVDEIPEVETQPSPHVTTDGVAHLPDKVKRRKENMNEKICEAIRVDPLRPMREVHEECLNNVLHGRQPKFTFSHFTRDPNIHMTKFTWDPNIHMTKFTRDPNLHNIKFTRNPNLHNKFTHHQICTGPNLHKTKFTQTPNLHKHNFTQKPHLHMNEPTEICTLVKNSEYSTEQIKPPKCDYFECLCTNMLKVTVNIPVEKQYASRSNHI